MNQTADTAGVMHFCEWSRFRKRLFENPPVRRSCRL